MLGRLEMNIDDCIAAYVQLIEIVFEKPSRWSLSSLFGKIEPQFDAKKLRVQSTQSSAAVEPTQLTFSMARRNGAAGCK